MAIDCVNSGKELPESGDGFPVYSAAEQEGGAALFTQITAETEAWKTPAEVKQERAPRSEKQKQLFLYSVGAAAFLLVAVLAILYIQPVNRVIRAINSGDYAGAKDIYWSDSGLASGAHDDEISRAVLRAAEKITSDYASRSIDGSRAARALATLGGIGADSDALLSDTFAEFRVYADSQDHMAEAEKLSLNGEYLAARDEYLLVLEDDANYPAARESADASLLLYADSVLAEADMLIQSGDYGGAVHALEEGERVLLDYEVFNEKLDFKLSATYALFEQELLSQAAELAAGRDYGGAAALLRQGAEEYPDLADALGEAAASYAAMEREQLASDLAAEALEKYEAGDAEGAFALLDTGTENEEIPREAVEAQMEALERRFSEDAIARARAAFARDRDSLPDAVAILNDALHIRRLAAIEDYRADISRYLPANLSEIEYAEKSGAIFRSAGAFESLDGTSYSDGWVWGEDGATLTFEINGAYDLLEGVFTVRRQDETEAGAYFEILCDGETAYTSPTVEHLLPETVPVSVDVSGCEKLVLCFHNDYSVRTADDGYCYHGLCDAFLTKDIA